jgi:hypothetical protein
MQSAPSMGDGDTGNRSRLNGNQQGLWKAAASLIVNNLLASEGTTQSESSATSSDL